MSDANTSATDFPPAATAGAGFYPPFPPRHADWLSWPRFIRLIRQNGIAVWPEVAFDEEWIERPLFRHTRFIANCPQAVKHVLLDNADNYAKDAVARRLLVGLGQGLLTSEGETWRRQRRVMAPIFQHKRMAALAPAMTAASTAMMARWDRSAAGGSIDISEAMMRLTLAIIASTMFSAESEDEIAAVGDAVTEYMFAVRPSVSALLGLPNWLPDLAGRKGRKAIAKMNAVFDRVIARRAGSGGSGDDLLALLLAARDEESGAGLSAVEVRDQVATIFTAGHETTANALAWTWFLLSGAPAVEEKLRGELARVLAGRAPEFVDLPALVYTRMVVEEAMRLYPPAHTTSREALADDEVMGRPVPRGSVVVISPWLLHRHRKLWDDPDRFDPERFAPERAAARPRFAYMPFGGGPRICIGASFAMTEAVLILAAVAQRYRLRLRPGHRVEPVGFITFRPGGGLPMLIERR